MLASFATILLFASLALVFSHIKIAFKKEKIHLEIFLRHNDSVVNQYLLDLVDVLSLNDQVFYKKHYGLVRNCVDCCYLVPFFTIKWVFCFFVNLNKNFSPDLPLFFVFHIIFSQLKLRYKF